MTMSTSRHDRPATDLAANGIRSAIADQDFGPLMSGARLHVGFKMPTATNGKVRVHPASPIVTVAVMRRNR
jgi:hypothetical protein